eukprot:sb/3466110/
MSQDSKEISPLGELTSVHCCGQAETVTCRNLCLDLYRNWLSSDLWSQFTQKCRYKPSEERMTSCILDGEGLLCSNPPLHLCFGGSVPETHGFFEVVTPLGGARVFISRDSPHLLSLFDKNPDITGKSIIKIMLFPVISGFLSKSESKWGLSRANTTTRDKRGVTTSKNPTSRQSASKEIDKVKPLDLFRTCTKKHDEGARTDYMSWLQTGFIQTPLVNLTVQNISTCRPDTWKGIACVLQTQPCNSKSHSNSICNSVCVDLLETCLDTTRSKHSVGEICRILAPNSDTETCVDLQHYLVPGLDHSDGIITHPCQPSPCRQSQQCVLNRNCATGDMYCTPYLCLDSKNTRTQVTAP